MRTLKDAIDSISEWKNDEHGASYARTAEKYLGKTRVTAVTQEYVNSLLDRASRKVSPSTLNRHAAIIKKVLTAAGRTDIKIGKVAVPEPERAGFTPAELAAVDVWMKNNASMNQQALYVILRDTGARPGNEVRNINLDWVMGSGGKTVRLYSGKGGKGLRYRDVPLSEEASGAMKYLLLNSLRISDVTGFNALWRRMVSELFNGNTSIVPYTLRHTFARRLINAGIPLHVISRMMGHASVETTMQYIRVNPQETDLVRQALSQ
jgi:integrase